MVSILATEIYNETLTGVTFPDGDRIRDFSFSFPTRDVSSDIGGFAYVEEIIATTNFSQSITVISTSDFHRPGSDVIPSFVYDNNLNLITNTEIRTFQDALGAGSPSNPSGGNLSFTGQGSETLDIYVDTPAEFSADLELNADGGVDVDGTVTTDITCTVSVIGRKP